MVSARQFTLLNEMGIELWQRKSQRQAIETNDTTAQTDIAQGVAELANTKQDNAAQNKTISIDFNALLQNALFQDILLSLNLSSADVSLVETEHEHYLNLGFLNWKMAENAKISINDATLITPPLTEIANNSGKSNELKKQLWQLIHQKINNQILQ